MTLPFEGLQPISKELDIWKNSVVTWVRTRNEGRDTWRNPSKPMTQLHVQKSSRSPLGLLLSWKITGFPSLFRKGKPNSLKCSRILFSDLGLQTGSETKM